MATTGTWCSASDHLRTSYELVEIDDPPARLNRHLVGHSGLVARLAGFQRVIALPALVDVADPAHGRAVPDFAYRLRPRIANHFTPELVVDAHERAAVRTDDQALERHGADEVG